MTDALSQLSGLIGRETSSEQVCQTLRDVAVASGAATVGAHLITCSDEVEGSVAAVFQSEFVVATQPGAAALGRSAFHTANLGGRHEWGALAMAEQHFAAPLPTGGFKLMVVKINSHVGVLTTDEGPVWGQVERLGRPSPSCGALLALLNRMPLSVEEELRSVFQVNGVDLLRALHDNWSVPPEQRMLFAATLHARLQAEQVFAEIEEHHPLTPTLYLVVPCVTLNCRFGNTEMVVGIGAAGEGIEYEGLGTDPGLYRVSLEGEVLRITEARRSDQPH